jgi:hypothetical protein
MPITMQQNIGNPTADIFSLSIYDVNTFPLIPFQFASGAWNSGRITLRVNGMGDRFGFNDIIWNNANVSPLLASGNVLLANTVPNLTISLPNTDVSFNTMPLLNFPPGEYMFNLNLINSVLNITASYKDTLYITGV